LTELAAEAGSSRYGQPYDLFKPYVQWHVENIDTRYLERAALVRNNLSALLALKWLAERRNIAAQSFWEASHTWFISPRETDESIPQRAGLYLLNPEGKVFRLSYFFKDRLLVLANLPPHPLDKPSVLKLDPPTDLDPGTYFVKQGNETGYFLKDEELRNGYPIQVSGEQWILKKYVPEGPPPTP
jgi:hypothetical protein